MIHILELGNPETGFRVAVNPETAQVLGPGFVGIPRLAWSVLSDET